MCDCNQEAHPGKDTSFVSAEQQQVAQIPSSSHLSATTDDSNLMEAADVDKHKLHEAW